MKTLLPIAFATATIFFAACEAKVNTTPGTTEKETKTIITPGAPAPTRTETNTSTTITPSGVQQSTTTEKK